jgi:hypothetical protein
LEWDSEAGNDVVEEKMRCCVNGVVEGRNGFDAFGKVIYCHDDVLVPISRRRIASHEFNAPFAEGVDSDD